MKTYREIEDRELREYEKAARLNAIIDELVAGGWLDYDAYTRTVSERRKNRYSQSARLQAMHVN